MKTYPTPRGLIRCSNPEWGARLARLAERAHDLRRREEDNYDLGAELDALRPGDDPWRAIRALVGSRFANALRWEQLWITGSQLDLDRALYVCDRLLPGWDTAIVDEIPGEGADCRGRTEYGPQHILLKRDDAHPGQVAKVAYHELGHALDRDGQRRRGLAGHCECVDEQVAETVSFLVSHEVGLDDAINEESTALYLASCWHDDFGEVAVPYATGYAERILAVT